MTFSLEPCVSAESAISSARNAKAELRIQAKFAKQELGGDRLCQAGGARYQLTHGFDGPNDGRNSLAGNRPSTGLHGADTTNEAQGYARRRDPQCDPNSDDKREGGQEKAVLTRREP